MTAQVEEQVFDNAVSLRGRVAAAPEERDLPSGDRLITFRIVVPREPRSRRGRPGPSVDTFDCCAWSKASQRKVLTWQAGDVVQVHGRLRRRFFSTGAGKGSRVEVEMSQGKIIRRASA